MYSQNLTWLCYLGENCTCPVLLSEAELSPYRRRTGRKHVVAWSGFLKVWSHLQKQEG